MKSCRVDERKERVNMATTDMIQNTDKRAIELLEAVFGDVKNIKLPVNLNEVLDYLGLTLREGTFEKDELAGALDRANKTIFVASSDSYERKNFTTAHEIGHFRLHEDVQTDIFYRYQVKQLNPEDNGRESEANLFAGSLLMPEIFVRDLWTVTKDIEKLAQIFGVSPGAVRYRLKHLNLK